MRHELTINAKGMGTETASGSVASFETDISRKIPSLSADIIPVQDLNGYEKPWPGGGGKNKLAYPYYNTTKTLNGITWTDNGDGTITANGTATSVSQFSLTTSVLNSDYQGMILSGCPSGGSANTYQISAQVYNSPWTQFAIDRGSGVTISDSGYENIRFIIQIAKDVTVNNLVFKPMIRLAAETDPTFEPYSNICPITGWTEANVTRVGKNLRKPTGTSKTQNGVTFTETDGILTLSGTATARTYDLVNAPTQSDIVQRAALLPTGSYKAVANGSGDTSNQVMMIRLYDESFTQVEQKDTGTGALAFECSVPCYAYLRLGAAEAGSANITYKPVIVKSTETDTSYEPYQGETYSVTFPTEAGTVYGGYVDVAKGKLVVDTELVSFFTQYEWFSNTYNGFTMYNVLPKKTTNYAGLCNMLPTFDTLSGTTPNVVFGLNNRHLYTGGIIGNIPGVTDAASWKAYLTENPMQVTRPLAAPITYDLSDVPEIVTLIGQNNIWSGLGGVSVMYAKLIEAIEHKLTIREGTQ